MEEPETARKFRDELLDTLDDDVPVLLTTNPGCAMYLRAGLVKRGQPMRVAHPVELLAEQLLPVPDNSNEGM